MRRSPLRPARHCLAPPKTPGPPRHVMRSDRYGSAGCYNAAPRPQEDRVHTEGPHVTQHALGGTVDHVWWSDAVIYEVYIRSFAASDGDGMGDLQGSLERLDHIP